MQASEGNAEGRISPIGEIRPSTLLETNCDLYNSDLCSRDCQAEA
jgi:hypothetical protein